MIDLVQIILTASATLLAGILLLIATEIITKLVIAPFLKLRGSIGEIAYNLVFYANYLRNKSAARSDTFYQAKTRCRELACQLRAEAATIVGYPLLAGLRLLPTRKEIIEASQQLIALSNTPENPEPGENTPAYQRIAVCLKIPEIFN